MSQNCLNCDQTVSGNFCANCGQKTATHRFTLHEWLHEIPHAILHVDGGFFLTIKTLTLRHGNAIREYLTGRRKLLFSPFMYLLVLCGTYVVLSHYLPSTGEHSEVLTAGGIKTLQDANDFIEGRYFKFFAIIMILPLTISTLVVYLRSGYNFAEHLVLNTYLMAQLVIADIILLLMSFGLGEKHSATVKIAELLLKYPYWIVTYWCFFQPKRWYWGILQFILGQIIAGLLVNLLLYLGATILLNISSGAGH